jgi:hypothetical protein
MKKGIRLSILVISIFMLASQLSACSTTALPVFTQTPYIIVITNTPTADLGPYMTQAAETVFVALTQTASAMVTNTPEPPTITPTPLFTSTYTSTPSPIATNTIYYSPTPVKSNTPKPTATAENRDYSCEVTWQLIEDNHEFSPNEDFDGRWTIKNTGNKTWQAIDVDYRYMSGKGFHTAGNVFDLPSDVAPDGSITITVDMKTPGESGYYETFWALARHAEGFCTLPVRIKVR